MGEKTVNKDNITMSNNEHRESSRLLNQEKGDLTNILDTELTLEDIQKSIKIGDENETVQEITKNVISCLPLNKELYNSTFINIDGGTFGTELPGVYNACKLLKDNPEDKVVLYGIMGPRYFMYEDHDIGDLLMLKRCLEFPNCVFVDEFEIGDVRFGHGYNEEFYKRLCEHIQYRKYDYILKVRHHLKHKCKIEVDELLKNKELVLKSYDEYNSYYGPYTFEEFVNIIVYEKGNKEGINTMEGKKLKGVYCDMDGTLILDDKDGFIVNQKVLDYLEEQERLGNEVHIWTGGNIDEQQEKLKRFGIKYPLISKYEYRGSEAETIIDDQDYDSFTSDYGIKVQNYINVNDL